MSPEEREAMCRRNCAPLVTAEEIKAREILLPVSDWTEKLGELQSWTGSAWLAGEEPEADEERRAECYTFLCGLIGYLMAGEDAAQALARKDAANEGGERFKWAGEGPEPARWTAADGTVVYRSYEDYCDD